MIGERRLDAARAHGVDQNAVRRESVGQRFDESVLRGIDYRRGNGVGLRHLAGLTDDDDEAASFFLAHVRHHRARQLPGAEHFGLEMREHFIAVDVFQPAGQMGAGIAHHDVDAAERLDDIVGERGDVSGRTEIGGEGLGGCERARGAVELGAVAAADGDPAAFGGEFPCNGKADAARAAGDQRDFIFQSEIHGRALSRRRNGGSRRQCSPNCRQRSPRNRIPGMQRDRPLPPACRCGRAGSTA